MWNSFAQGHTDNVYREGTQVYASGPLPSLEVEANQHSSHGLSQPFFCELHFAQKGNKDL